MSGRAAGAASNTLSLSANCQSDEPSLTPVSVSAFCCAIKHTTNT